MRINWKVVKSVSWISSAVSAVLLLIKAILSAFGIMFETEAISTAINAILGVLAAAGLITGTQAAATVSTQEHIETVLRQLRN